MAEITGTFKSIGLLNRYYLIIVSKVHTTPFSWASVKVVSGGTVALTTLTHSQEEVQLY